MEIRMRRTPAASGDAKRSSERLRDIRGGQCEATRAGWQTIDVGLRRNVQFSGLFCVVFARLSLGLKATKVTPNGDFQQNSNDLEDAEVAHRLRSETLS